MLSLQFEIYLRFLLGEIPLLVDTFLQKLSECPVLGAKDAQCSLRSEFPGCVQCIVQCADQDSPPQY